MSEEMIEKLDLRGSDSTSDQKRLSDWRIQIKVSEEFYKRFDDYCKKFRLTKSQLGNICLQSGFNAIVRAVSPEEIFTPEQIVKIVRAMEKEGLDVDISKLLGGENWRT